MDIDYNYQPPKNIVDVVYGIAGKMSDNFAKHNTNVSWADFRKAVFAEFAASEYADVEKALGWLTEYTHHLYIMHSPGGREVQINQNNMRVMLENAQQQAEQTRVDSIGAHDPMSEILEAVKTVCLALSIQADTSAKILDKIEAQQLPPESELQSEEEMPKIIGYTANNGYAVDVDDGMIPRSDASTPLGQETADAPKSPEKPQQKENRDMSRKPLMEATKSSGGSLFAAAKTGAKISGSQAVARQIVAAVRRITGDSHPAFFQSSLGQKVEPAVLIAVVHVMANSFADALPHADKVMAACEYAMTGEVKDHADEVIKQFEPIFLEIAQMAPKGLEARVAADNVTPIEAVPRVATGTADK